MLPELPKDVLLLIAGYVVEPVYQLSPEFGWSLGLLRNPKAGKMIREFLSTTEMTREMAVELVNNPNPEFLDLIDFNRFRLVRDLCRHPSAKAMEILSTIPEPEWHWDMLSANPCAISLLQKNVDKIVWRDIANNPAAYQLIKDTCAEKEMSCWDCFYLLRGIHSQRLYEEIPDRLEDSAVYNAVGLFYQSELDSVPMSELCAKPDRLEVLKNIPVDQWSLSGLVENPNPEVVGYIAAWLEYASDIDPDETGWLLSKCRHPEVIEFLLEDPELCEHAHGLELSGNPAAIDALLQNREWVNWMALADNPSPRAVEVVRKYIHSFRASRYNQLFYKREEVLDVDVRETEKLKVKFYLG